MATTVLNLVLLSLREFGTKDFPVAREFPPITTLIPDLRDGDENTWNALVALFSPSLSGKASVLLRDSKLQNKLAVEDLVNETLTKAWKHHRLIRGQSTFQIAKWLLTIMVNSFRDHCRKGGLPEEAQPEWESPIDQAAGPSSDIEAFEQEVKLHAALAELDEEDRTVLLLKYWHGLTHEQIAAKIGTSKASVTRRVHKLLPELNDMMEKS